MFLIKPSVQGYETMMFSWKCTHDFDKVPEDRQPFQAEAFGVHVYIETGIRVPV